MPLPSPPPAPPPAPPNRGGWAAADDTADDGAEAGAEPNEKAGGATAAAALDAAESRWVPAGPSEVEVEDDCAAGAVTAEVPLLGAGTVEGGGSAKENPPNAGGAAAAAGTAGEGDAVGPPLPLLRLCRTPPASPASSFEAAVCAGRGGSTALGAAAGAPPNENENGAGAAAPEAAAAGVLTGEGSNRGPPPVPPSSAPRPPSSPSKEEEGERAPRRAPAQGVGGAPPPPLARRCGCGCACRWAPKAVPSSAEALLLLPNSAGDGAVGRDGGSAARRGILARGPRDSDAAMTEDSRGCGGAVCVPESRVTGAAPPPPSPPYRVERECPPAPREEAEGATSRDVDRRVAKEAAVAAVPPAAACGRLALAVTVSGRRGSCPPCRREESGAGSC